MSVEGRPFWAALEDGGRKTALIEARQGQAVTYLELARLADEAAEREPISAAKALVFLKLPATIAAVARLLGAWRAGHAVHILKPDAPAEREALLARLYGDGASLHPDLMLLLATSGSTGDAKLARLSARNLTVNASQIISALEIDPEARPLLNLPLSHTYGLSVLTSHLARHATVILNDRSFLDPDLWTAFRAHRADGLHGVPASYALLRAARAKGLALDGLRTLTQSGEALPAATADWMRDDLLPRGVRVYKMYGMTEATARACVLPPEAFADHPGSVGRPVPGGAITIEDGEVVFRGPNVMMGYAHGRDDLARGDDLNGLLRTNDTGELDANGFLRLTGRLDRVGKVDGQRLNLAEIEREFFPDQAVALTVSDGRLSIIHELALGDPARRARDLAAALKLMPANVTARAVAALPRLDNGKIDYRALPG